MGRRCTRSGVGQAQQDAQVGFRQQSLGRQLLRQVGLHSLQFLHARVRPRSAARDLRVEIAADYAAERNRKHDPERHAGESPELERGMEGDDEGRGEPQEHMDIEPVPGAPVVDSHGQCLRSGYRKMTRNMATPKNPRFKPMAPLGRRRWCLGEKGRSAADSV